MRRSSASTSLSSKPIDAAAFLRMMRPFAPFEAHPRIAVAVSGGADSMALMLLAARWAKAKGGSAVGLTVDHGLRPAARAEARRVKAWLGDRGIAHATLRWSGPKPKANLQAQARAARYRLLEGWCRKSGVLHLLLAQQQEDQAETFLLRLGRGSGVDGLAAMAPVTESPWLRFLRPVLDVPRARLVATLEAAGQDWIEDPSNRDPRFGRVRMRALQPALAREGLETTRLAETAARLGRARQALDRELGLFLARAARIDAAGYGVIERQALAQAPAELALRALACLLRCIGGDDYAPRLARLERLYREIVETGLPAARTLGGCRVLRLAQSAGERLLVCREPGAAEAHVPIGTKEPFLWDGRFLVRVPGKVPGPGKAWRLGALGEAGWAALVARMPRLRQIPIPAAVKPSLPALFDLEGVRAVPHLSYGRDGAGTGTVSVHVAFRPVRPLAIGPVGIV